MELAEAEKKYLHKVVCHMATGLTFEVTELVELGRLTKDRIELHFKHLVEEEIPIGQQSSATLREIEIHYRIVT
ncbi:hypothetical protein CNR22_17695 [Sphingobacteriaceae bacterium]|nr:hypothetical protein CNR22_17695 [Sphingobacteriaceae bacterium]